MDVIDLILLEERYYKSVCKNVTKGNHLHKDLFQDFIEKVLLNIDKFRQANAEGYLASYCTRTITNLWNDRDQVKTNVNGKTSDLHLISNQSYQPESIKVVEPEKNELALSELKLLYYSGNTIQREQAEITMKVINLEGRTNISKASRELNRSYSSVYTAVNNTTKLIKQKI